VISGGNTGALMAMALFALHRMEGISRPAIAAIWPTTRADIIVLDVGATVGGDAQQLVDFSILGAALARALFDQESPSLGLLNVGTEEMKGHDEVKEAARVLAGASGKAGFTYHGFVEGDDMGKGTVDVVVTDGFAGNIALKTAEGTARQVGTWMRDAFRADLISKIGAFIAGQAINALRRKLDPRNISGGIFLGLNGIVIKSHGGTDEVGFKAAVGLAYEMARSRLMDKIGEGLRRFPTLELEAVSAPEPEKKPA
jgi:glycerol-3-phosphate acyltransferase PlsX